MMRASLLCAVLLVALASCTHDFLAPNNLTGAWATPFSIPASGYRLTLSQVGDSVFGSGIIEIEAGPTITLTLSGRYERPQLRLRMVSDRGGWLDYDAHVTAVRMSGTVTNSLGQTFTMELGKR